MRFFTSLVRSSCALWICPLAIALAVWYSNKSAVYAPFDPYFVEHTAAGADPLFLTVSIVAACAAWEGGRLRRAGWIGVPHVRPTLLAIFPMLAPPLAAGFAATLAGLAWKLHLGNAGMLPDARFLPTFIVVVAALVVLGFATGTILPAAIATPITLVGVYLWMAIPGAVTNPIWLRHLSGRNLGACCSLNADIDTRALIAPIVVSAGFFGAALVLLLARRQAGAVRLLAVALPIILGLLGGATLASGLSREPVTARSNSLLICSDGSPRICVWPEHRILLQEATELASPVVAAWSHVGINVPHEFTEAFPLSPSPGQRSIWLSTGADSADIVQAFSQSMLPEWPECEGDLTGDADQPAFLGYDAEDYVLAWFEATAGVSRETLERDYGNVGIDGEPSVLATVERVPFLRMSNRPGCKQTWPRYRPAMSCRALSRRT